VWSAKWTASVILRLVAVEEIAPVVDHDQLLKQGEQVGP